MKKRLFCAWRNFGLEMDNVRVVGTHSENIKSFSRNLILTFSCMSTHYAITPIQIRKRRKVADLEDFRKIPEISSRVLIALWKGRPEGLSPRSCHRWAIRRISHCPGKQHIKSLSLRYNQNSGFWFPIVVVILVKDEKNKYCQFNK